MTIFRSLLAFGLFNYLIFSASFNMKLASSQDTVFISHDRGINSTTLKQVNFDNSGDDDIPLGSQHGDSIEDSVQPNNDGDDDDALGSRGDCSQPMSFANLPPMSILSPVERTEQTTTEALPTFLVYVPFELSNDDPGRFLVESENGDLLYETNLRSSDGNELIRIQLDRPLEIGESYSLSFQVYCDDAAISNPASDVVYADVIRVGSENVGEAGYDQLRDAYDDGMLSSENWQDLIESDSF